MNRIWVRLALSHAALVLGAILVVTFVTGQVLELALRREAARQMATRGGLVQRLSELSQTLRSRQDWRAAMEAVPGLRRGGGRTRTHRL